MLNKFTQHTALPTGFIWLANRVKMLHFSCIARVLIDVVPGKYVFKMDKQTKRRKEEDGEDTIKK